MDRVDGRDDDLLGPGLPDHLIEVGVRGHIHPCGGFHVFSGHFQPQGVDVAHAHHLHLVALLGEQLLPPHPESTDAGADQRHPLLLRRLACRGRAAAPATTALEVLMKSRRVDSLIARPPIVEFSAILARISDLEDFE